MYVNSRPMACLITEAVETGIHSNVEHGRTAIVRRVGKKVGCYQKVLRSMFRDVWQSSRQISWLDVGAGYGEIVEAVSTLAPQGSRTEGIEPMRPKAKHTQALGLKVSEKYLCDVTKRFDFVSLIHVYSHIPDFRAFLSQVKNVLTDGGEFFIETGNIGDLARSCEVPTELDLPDHLVFAGERHLMGYLSDAGFSVVAARKSRKDGVVNFAKNVVKTSSGERLHWQFRIRRRIARY